MYKNQHFSKSLLLNIILYLKCQCKGISFYFFLQYVRIGCLRAVPYPNATPPARKKAVAAI